MTMLTFTHKYGVKLQSTGQVASHHFPANYMRKAKKVVIAAHLAL